MQSIKKQIQITAAAIKAADARITSKCKRIIVFNSNTRQFIQFIDINFFHRSPKLTIISAMVILISAVTPEACRSSFSKTAMLR